MINAILQGIISLIMTLVDVLLSPIDLLIETFLPDLSSGISAIGSMFDYALTYVSYLVDMTLLSSSTISLIILYYTFKLTAPIAFSTVKLAISWYKSLKL